MHHCIKTPVVAQSQKQDWLDLYAARGQTPGSAGAPPVILGLDIGNTSTTAGIYNDSDIIPFAIYRHPTVKNTDHRSLAIQIIEGMKQQDGGIDRMSISGVAFSSVVPEVNRAYHEMAKSPFGGPAFEINCRRRLNFTIRYNDPEQLGADRIVNAAAAFAEYGGGSIIVDIGTAVTFCVLLEGGVFDGGILR